MLTSMIEIFQIGIMLLGFFFIVMGFFIFLGGMNDWHDRDIASDRNKMEQAAYFSFAMAIFCIVCGILILTNGQWISDFFFSPL